MNRKYVAAFTFLALAHALAASSARAKVVEWQVGNGNSPPRMFLTLKGQNMDLTELGLAGTYNVRPTNNNATSASTFTNSYSSPGNQSFTSGTVTTVLTNVSAARPFGTSIYIPSNQGTMYGIPANSWYPNDSSWNSTTQTYGAGSSPGVFGFALGIGQNGTSTSGYPVGYQVNLPSLTYELNTNGAYVPISANTTGISGNPYDVQATIPSNSIMAGIQSALFDAAGKTIAGLGTLSSLHDLIGGDANVVTGNIGTQTVFFDQDTTDGSTETISLIIPMTIPISFQLANGLFLPGTLSGEIGLFAYNVSLVPEPGSIVLAVIGTAGLLIMGLQRRRQQR